MRNRRLPPHVDTACCGLRSGCAKVRWHGGVHSGRGGFADWQGFILFVVGLRPRRFQCRTALQRVNERQVELADGEHEREADGGDHVAAGLLEQGGVVVLLRSPQRSWRLLCALCVISGLVALSGGQGEVEDPVASRGEWTGIRRV